MKPRIQQVKGKRHFTETFKKKIVEEYERGKFTVKELEKIYHVSNVSIYSWIYKYSFYNKKSIKVVEMTESSNKKLKQLETRINELERSVGQKQLYIDYMEKMMEIAKDELGVDIKKNYNTLQSSGSDKIKKK
jgi:transposase-like protein